MEPEEFEINPDSPLFNEEIGVSMEDDFDDFDVINRLRLIEITINRFGMLPIKEWIEKMGQLEDWIYGMDDMIFEPDTKD